jgi:hypothetical protein
MNKNYSTYEFSARVQRAIFTIFNQIFWINFSPAFLQKTDYLMYLP